MRRKVWHMQEVFGENRSAVVEADTYDDAVDAVRVEWGRGVLHGHCRFEGVPGNPVAYCLECR